MSAVTDGDAETKRHFAYTPFAWLRMGTLNPAAFEQFEAGKVYRVTLEEHVPQVSCER